MRLPGGRRKPTPAPDGSMPLREHLRELRNRLVKGVLAILVGSIVAFFFYDQLFDLLKDPYTDGVDQLIDEGQDINAELTLTGVSDAFTLNLKVSLVAGIVVSSPVWLWQIWAFIMPGLHENERRWGMVFAAVAGPLFAIGIATGYYVLPKGIEILIGFTPTDVSNLTSVTGYLNFVLRMLLVFGVAFEIPLFVLLLNLAGVLKGRQLGEYRPWIILGVFVFAAVATPSTDPISMLFLAIPMAMLFLISEVLARLIDRRRGVSLEGDYDTYDDDERSDLEIPHDPDDDRPSRLDD
ncbi:twin-arginine translocase subunit TatC [Solicola gregarius]|uniref:Sec-independent protein translocase protein TatC n=1 Tax=Solicola gregarius TaxID=2908642 RepID=A0AA46THS1_9ACTN|nr:twin-arginine translocase subunit TatC [Solicola gregarius]UYM05057.1 twin-arginine translocase subunit TatC [Solicola gregarius]